MHFAVYIICTLALIGNNAGLSVLASWNPDWVTMKDATALSLAAIAYMTGLKTYERKPYAFFAFACVALSMLTYFKPMPALYEVESIRPGLPSLGTAISVILLLSKSRAAGFIAALLGAFAVLGHFVEASHMYYYFEDISTGMAVNTGVCLALLGTEKCLKKT